jgi:hypothetical protein
LEGLQTTSKKEKQKKSLIVSTHRHLSGKQLERNVQKENAEL